MNLPRPSRGANRKSLRRRGENAAAFIIREVVEADVPALAALHVKAWSQTYWMALRHPTLKIREWQWRELFKNKDGSWFCFVIENGKNELIGFAMGKKYSHSDLPDFSGELSKIYILREYQGVGLGKRLIGYVARKFISIGIHNMVLFGIAENPSGGFHEAMGGEKLFAQNGEFHGGYCWRDLQQLATTPL